MNGNSVEIHNLIKRDSQRIFDLIYALHVVAVVEAVQDEIKCVLVANYPVENFGHKRTVDSTKLAGAITM